MDKLTILQWNIRSIAKNKPYLEHIIANYQPDVILLQETFDQTAQGAILENFQEPTRIKYVNTAAKGLSTYVDKNHTQTALEINITEDYESTTIKLEDRKGKEYIITNVHRKAKSIKKFKDHINDILTKYDGSNHIVAGDFNLHHPLWDNEVIQNPYYDSYIKQSDQIANLIQDHETVLLNDGRQTRIDDGDKLPSAIDLTIINKHTARLNSEWILLDDSSPFDRGNSDHIPIISILGNNNIEQPENKNAEFDYKRLDKNKLKKELTKIEWEEIRKLNGNELDTKINSILVEALKQASKKTKRI